MKKIIILSAVLFMSASVHAISIIGWERPIRQATMVIELGTGQFSWVDSAKVVLTKKDGSMGVTGIQVTFGEEKPVFFHVSEIKNKNGECSSQELVAYPVANENWDYSEAEMVLVDYGKDCNKFSYEWEIQMIQGSEETSNFGELILTGSSSSVFTIQSQDPQVSAESI